MQVRAIVSATLNLEKLSPKISVYPSLTLPFVTTDHELEKLIPLIQKAIAEEYANQNVTYHESSISFSIGASISTPIASIRSAALAPLVRYISFDIVSLTEYVFGCTEKTASQFMPQYLRDRIVDTNPFERIDDPGFSALIQSSVENARSANPHLKVVAISSKHTSDSVSVQLLRNVKTDTISCAAANIALSKLIAAQVSIRFTDNGNVVSDTESEYLFPFRLF
jgi:pyruvate, orthophosphate dikinase